VVHNGFGRKTTAKNVLNTKRMKNAPYMSVLKLSLLVDLQHKVAELIISITYCPSIIILEDDTSNWRAEKNVVMITLITGVMFLLFTCMHVWVWGILCA
jgi:hypothetical protein